MRVLAVGALWVPYIKENWFDALRHVLGDDVLCVNVAPLLTNKEQYTGQEEGMHCAYIYDLLRRENFDYLFFYHDWVFGDFPDEFFEKVRSIGVKTIAFHPDDEPEHWYSRNASYDHHYDIVASHSSAGVERRRLVGWGERVMYLPWGYNSRACYPLANITKKYDVIFFGKHKVNDQQGKAHVEDGFQRENVLVELADLAIQQGWTFRVFGFGWNQHPQLKKFSGGIPSQDEMVQIINQTKIVFNPAWSSDGDLTAVQTKLRHFEVPGYGAFQITNENHELSELYTPDKEIVFYRTNDELFEKVKYYLSNNSERELIAKASHQRSLKEHTLDHRVRELFSHVQKVYPPSKDNSTSVLMPSIKQIRIDNVNELQKLDLDELLRDEAEWFHFLAGNFKSITTDYRILLPFLQNKPDNILCINTYVEFEGNIINPLQPKLIENHSRVIGRSFPSDSYEFSLLDDGCKLFVGVEQEGVTNLLINYLVPAQHVKELIGAFSEGTLDNIEHLIAPISTGRIVSEVKLSLPKGFELHWPNFNSFEYVKRLRVLLPYFKAQNWNVVVYGISGMGKVTLDLIEQEGGLDLVGIIDRSLASAYFNQIPVINTSDLPKVNPDVIILTSGASGASIYSDIKHLEAGVCILPLYDLDHPIWSVLGL